MNLDQQQAIQDQQQQQQPSSQLQQQQTLQSYQQQLPPERYAGNYQGIPMPLPAPPRPTMSQLSSQQGMGSSYPLGNANTQHWQDVRTSLATHSSGVDGRLVSMSTSVMPEGFPPVTPLGMGLDLSDPQTAPLHQTALNVGQHIQHPPQSSFVRAGYTTDVSIPMTVIMSFNN